VTPENLHSLQRTNLLSWFSARSRRRYCRCSSQMIRLCGATAWLRPLTIAEPLCFHREHLETSLGNPAESNSQTHNTYHGSVLIVIVPAHARKEKPDFKLPTEMLAVWRSSPCLILCLKCRRYIGLRLILSRPKSEQGRQTLCLGPAREIGNIGAGADTKINFGVYRGPGQMLSELHDNPDGMRKS
jgi:hypothetical protein